jgi:hypothetical protein
MNIEFPEQLLLSSPERSQQEIKNVRWAVLTAKLHAP